ncbi:hypothetical protein GTA08_BOTSDO06115 [Botryosphaeria dothidea]|uniref:Uncharacterized protein n=1 Tax=Botryosphaeria dothidea TaxID=55169 RepID=A0A8H4N0Z0_9PEZI|nr:hypothetical protein GTA08_BOTSDO06115 [Botryosphaeria dothidea]
MDQAGLNTQERIEYVEELGRQRGLRLSGKIAQLGLAQTVSNKNAAAEKRRKRKRDAVAAHDARRQRQQQIPRPTQSAASREVRVWESLRSRPPQALQLIVEIKRDLEGGGALEWKERQGPRGRGRPAKGSQGRKVMSYLDAERWLTRAESVGRQRTLDEVVEALAQRRAAAGESAASKEPVKQVGEAAEQPAEETGQPDTEGHARQLTVIVPGASPPPNNQLQGRQQRAALSPPALYKALYGRRLDEVTEAITRERREGRGSAEGSQVVATGAAGHARNGAWDLIKRELADEPEKLRQLQSISTTAAWRWQQFFDQLGYGAIFLVGEADLPNSFVEKDLSNAEFQRFLDLVKRINPGVVELGDALWEAVGGPAALETGDFSFPNVDAEGIRRVTAQIGKGAAVQSSQGAVVYEVADSDEGEAEE